jgi:hypothetical protein
VSSDLRFIEHVLIRDAVIEGRLVAGHHESQRRTDLYRASMHGIFDILAQMGQRRHNSLLTFRFASCCQRSLS